MKTMKIYWILVFIGFLTGASSVSVGLNHSVSLPCGCGERVIWRKTFPIEATIAECQNAKCNTTDTRFAVMYEKNYSLFLKSAKYNDLGQYVCRCDDFVNQVKLEVVVPIDITAVVSGKVTLPCYADTQRDVRDVTWIRNDQKVLHYTANGVTKPGDGYEGRVSLPDDGFRDGDVSLTISGVQRTDAGLYRCFVYRETTRGEPHAHMLSVNEKLTNAGGNQTEGSNNEKRAHTGPIVLFSLFIFCFLVIIFWRKMMAASPTVKTADKLPVPESDQNGSTRPFSSGDETCELKPEDERLQGSF